MENSPFDDYSSQYENWFERNYWAYQSELLAIKEQLPKENNGIEIGVGSGRFAGPLGIKTGVDPSSTMAKLAGKRGINVLQSKAENLPFANSFFDFALMVTTICFVDDIEASFREAYRILKSGGHLIIGFVDKDSVLGKTYQEHKEKSVFYRFAKFYSVADVVTYLKNSGFNKFSVTQTIFEKLENIKNLELPRKGFGKGAFVVITAEKES